jgi:rhamnosyltransferase
MKVDILMASYNGEKYIKDQIESILNQTYKDFTLHISDDKSTDDTRKILKEYSKKDKRIALHLQEKNQGYLKNFEYLLTQATNDYIMLCDQDDVWLPNKVEVSVNKMIEDKLDLAICNMLVVDEELKIMNNSYFDFINLKLDEKLKFKDFLFRNPAAGCAMIFSKSLLDKILPFPNLKHPYYIHDWYIYMIGQAYGKVGFVNMPVSNYRQHSSNSVGMNRKTKKDFTFFRTARSININYRISFCTELLKKVDSKKKKEIKEFMNYLESLKKSKFINFKFNKFFEYSKLLGLKPKLKYFFIFHFPLYVLSKEVDENKKSN